MKEFWSDLFFDMEECDLTNEKAAEQYGSGICGDFDDIERAIKDFDLKRALILIQKAKKYY